jgi:hypothetical protein
MLDFQRDLKPSVFGPPEINLMRQALNLAWRSVCSGSPLANPDRRPIQEALAALILDHARRGELDPLILAAAAVEKFGRPLSCSRVRPLRHKRVATNRPGFPVTPLPFRTRLKNKGAKNAE